MSGDVYVSFGADTGELEGVFTLARAEAQNFQRQMAAVAREMAKTGMSADSELGKHLNELAAQFCRQVAYGRVFGRDAQAYAGSDRGRRIAPTPSATSASMPSADLSLPGSPSASKRSRNGSPRPRKRPRSSNG